jgi:hypothetical protein
LWAAFDRVERLAAAGKTLLARRLADTHQPDETGTKTAAEALARRGGTSLGAARDALETSTRLRDLPQVEAAVRRGDLSGAQAAAVTSAALADRSTEQRLLELASRASLPELREECARVKAAADPDPDATHRRLHRSRRLRRYTDPEGAWTLVAKGTPQAGAVINTALDPIIDEIFRAARRDGRQEPHDAYAFDALLVMANRACGVSVTIEERIEPGDAQGQGSVADTATVDSMLTAPPEPRSEQRIVTGPPRWLNPRYLALLRVDVEALRRGAVSGGELCEITGVGPVPVGRARELLGEAVLKLVITRGVDVCNVTHLGRGPTAAQKVALAWTGPGCAAEGCFRTRIEYDHREDWKKTRHTRLDELDPLCTYHHDLKTRLGWALVSGHGKRALVPPDDSRHPRHPPSMTDQLSDAGESNRQGAGRPHASKLQAGLEQQVALELSGTPPSVP